MPSRVIGLLLFFACFALPVGGQPSSALDDRVVLSLDDPVGDNSGPAAAGAGFTDLTRVDVSVGREFLDFRIAVANLDTKSAAPLGWELWLALEYRGSRLDAVIQGTFDAMVLPPEQQADVFGVDDVSIYRMDGDPQFIQTLPAYLDEATSSYNATVPLDVLAEPGGFFPRPGELLTILGAASFWSPLGSGTPHSPSPTGGAAMASQDTADFPDGTLVTMPGATGDLSLGTPLAIRYSNGEATTFHWAIEVSNHGERTLDVGLSLEALGLQGTGLEARLPPGVQLGPGENRTVSAYVTVPFAHQHGSSLRFPVVASAGTADRATLEIGVDYPSIAQPAGHHPDLYLHGRNYPILDTEAQFPGDSWMNTAEEDERAEEALFASRLVSCPGSQGAAGGNLEGGLAWQFPLDPGLRIGLDGRFGEAGSLDLSFDGPMPPATAYARLALFSHDTSAFDIFANGTDPYRGEVSLAGGQGPTHVALPLPIPPEIDLVPPGGQYNLGLAVLLCPQPGPAGFAVGTAHPVVSFLKQLIAVTAGHAILPLDEYHDPIAISDVGNGLHLSVPDPVRRAAPGATVLWQPNLEVDGVGNGRLAVRLFGNAAIHANLLTDVRIPIEDKVLPISLVVPDEAVGTVLDLLLEVTDEADPARSAAVRLSVVVDPTSSIDDAGLVAALNSEPKESPGLALGLLGSLFVALAVLRRRN